MLNYFLLQLVGPQRKSLSLKDPKKYEFHPKELLKQVSSKLKFLTVALSPTACFPFFFLSLVVVDLTFYCYFSQILGLKAIACKWYKSWACNPLVAVSSLETGCMSPSSPSEFPTLVGP